MCVYLYIYIAQYTSFPACSQSLVSCDSESAVALAVFIVLPRRSP